MTTRSGRMIAGRYRLVRTIGRGGMGTVWQARDVLLNRDVAVKRIRVPGADPDVDHPGDPKDPLVQRALREARAAARLQHPGVVKVYDVVTGQGGPWLVMELIDGRSLAQAIAEDGLFTERLAARIGLRVLEALRAAHRAGIVHRDVKPANIMLESNGGVVLTDFGIAAIDDATALTATGQMIGSPAYLAPERINGHPAGTPSDLWALGVTLYTAVTGQSPFQRADTQATLAAVLTSQPVAPAHACLLWPVIEGLLAKDPDRRLNIDQAHSRLMSVAAPTSIVSPQKRGMFFRRRRVIGVGAAALALTLIAVTGYEIFNRLNNDFVPLPGCGPEQKRETLRIVSSPEKAQVLADFAAGYGLRAAGDLCLRVDVVSMSSGDARDLLVDGWADEASRPHVWSPASSAWIAPVNGEYGLLPVSPTTDSLFTSPVVIAMLEPVAKGLGWPDRPIGWPDILNKARSKEIRFAKTNPNVSTSGLISTVAAFSAFAGLSTPNGVLTDDHVTDGAVQDSVRSLEKSVVHSQENTLDLLASLREKIDEGTAEAAQYLSAAAIEESSLVMFNKGHPCGINADKPTDDTIDRCEARRKDGRLVPPAVKLVAVYPSTGTLFSDHPYLKVKDLDEARSLVADNFLGFVRTPQSQETIRGYGFRSADGELPTGTDDLLLPDVPRSAIPQPAVLDRIRDVWPQVRKPVQVILAVDVSGSMRPKIAQVRRALKKLTDGKTFAGGDQVELWQFAGEHRQLVEAAPLNTSAQKAAFQEAIKNLSPEHLAPTSLCATVKDAVEDLRGRTDDTTNNAVVVLTDGDDKITQDTIKQVTNLIPGIRPGEDRAAIPVYTIAFGDQADEPLTIEGEDTTVLQKISGETGGRRTDASDTATLQAVLHDLASRF